MPLKALLYRHIGISTAHQPVVVVVEGRFVFPRNVRIRRLKPKSNHSSQLEIVRLGWWCGWERGRRHKDKYRAKKKPFPFWVQLFPMAFCGCLHRKLVWGDFPVAFKCVL